MDGQAARHVQDGAVVVALQVVVDREGADELAGRVERHFGAGAVVGGVGVQLGCSAAEGGAAVGLDLDVAERALVGRHRRVVGRVHGVRRGPGRHRPGCRVEPRAGQGALEPFGAAGRLTRARSAPRRGGGRLADSRGRRPARGSGGRAGSSAAGCKRGAQPEQGEHTGHQTLVHAAPPRRASGQQASPPARTRQP